MFKRLFSYFVCAVILAACGIPSPDPTTAQGKRAILDDVNTYLDTGNCPAALTEVLPLYNSSNTDNDVRIATASVYGCFAGINLFKFIDDIATSSSGGAGYPWSFFATEFPSKGNLNNPTDKVVESAAYGIDATMATLNPGEVLVPADLINVNTNNQGSLVDTDRTVDANLYLLFLSMAVIGGMENRAGASSSGHPTNSPALPANWVNPTLLNTVGTSGVDGCGFASAIVNLADALSISTGLSSQLKVLNSLNIPAAVYFACQKGCLSNGCSILTNCPSQCATSLRSRTGCANTVTDAASCGAAEINALIGGTGPPLGAWQ